MSKFPVKGAGTRLGKDLPQGRKPFDGAGNKKSGAASGKIGGTANGGQRQTYPKGGK